jgi:hypothetical protein
MGAGHGCRVTRPGAAYQAAGAGSGEQGSGRAGAVDGTLPPVDQVFFYLVHAQSFCPHDDGPLGTDSGGNAIPGRSCGP